MNIKLSATIHRFQVPPNGRKARWRSEQVHTVAEIRDIPAHEAPVAASLRASRTISHTVVRAFEARLYQPRGAHLVPEISYFERAPDIERMPWNTRPSDYTAVTSLMSNARAAFDQRVLDLVTNLIAVDGEIWQTCTEPVIAVSIRHGVSWVAARAQIGQLSLFESTPYRQTFSLAKVDQARAAAQSLLDREMEGINGDVVRPILDFDDLDGLDVRLPACFTYLAERHHPKAAEQQAAEFREAWPIHRLLSAIRAAMLHGDQPQGFDGDIELLLDRALEAYRD